MKVNKSKSPFVSGAADTPDEKDVARAIKGGKFTEALAALESAQATGTPDATGAALTEIAARYDLSNEENRQTAVEESAEYLVKSRLGEKYGDSEKVVKDLTEHVAADPFLKSKLLSILQKLNSK